MGESKLRWFEDYLANRQQRVFVNGVPSNYKEIEFGVPQGPCLGPLLYLIFINGISTYVDGELLSLYADDTAALMADSSFDIMNEKLQEVPLNLGRWCRHNRLSINIGKCKVIFF